MNGVVHPSLVGKRCGAAVHNLCMAIRGSHCLLFLANGVKACSRMTGIIPGLHNIKRKLFPKRFAKPCNNTFQCLPVTFRGKLPVVDSVRVTLTLHPDDSL